MNREIGSSIFDGLKHLHLHPGGRALGVRSILLFGHLVFVSDYDGTYAPLSEDHNNGEDPRLSEETLKAIRAITESGNTFITVTARSADNFPPLLRFLNGDTAELEALHGSYVLVDNGATLIKIDTTKPQGYEFIRTRNYNATHVMADLAKSFTNSNYFSTFSSQHSGPIISIDRADDSGFLRPVIIRPKDEELGAWYKGNDPHVFTYEPHDPASLAHAIQQGRDQGLYAVASRVNLYQGGEEQETSTDSFSRGMQDWITQSLATTPVTTNDRRDEFSEHEKFGATDYPGHHGLFGIINPWASKRTHVKFTLRWLVEHGYIPALYFKITLGDGEVDLELINKGHLGIAISHAKDKVKDVAHIVINGPHESGWAELVTSLLALQKIVRPQIEELINKAVRERLFENPQPPKRMGTDRRNELIYGSPSYIPLSLPDSRNPRTSLIAPTLDSLQQEANSHLTEYNRRLREIAHKIASEQMLKVILDELTRDGKKAIVTLALRETAKQLLQECNNVLENYFHALASYRNNKTPCPPGMLDTCAKPPANPLTATSSEPAIPRTVHTLLAATPATHPAVQGRRRGQPHHSMRSNEPRSGNSAPTRFRTLRVHHSR